ncbi:MAG: DNA polymerase III subunit gamma/tau [Spirochaetales bacterium]|nr:DNA polymerase III subunit gamma/tau [Spirochaetales bacterium]
MAFEVTATRRRPQTFQNLLGQDFLVSTLSNSLKAGHIAHAYLFSGPRGVGKTSSARILAKALNCEKGPTDVPCGKCPSCLEITRGNSIDVIEIDGASNTSVNDIRVIKDEVLFSPNSSRYKIYIIDEVHMLSNSAFNALLKTIEEPPPYIVFIFATTEVHKVPATIRSRCQQFNFRLIDTDIIIELLRQACSEMSVTAGDDALLWMAREATGSMRDAYTLLDQITSFSDGKITMKLIQQKLGLVGLEQLDELVQHIIGEDRPAMLASLEKILHDGVSVEQLIIDLADYFRSLLFIKSGITRESVLGCKKDRFPGAVTEAWSTERLEIALTMLFETFRNIRYSLNQRFELELLLSRFSSLNRYLTAEEMHDQLQALKKQLAGNTIISASEPSGPESGSEKKNTPDLNKIRSSLIEGTKKDHLTLSRNLANASAWGFQDDTIQIYFDNNFSANQVKENVLVLHTLIKESENAVWPIEIKLKKDSNENTNPETDPGNHEAVEMVKKVFRGEIISGETQ